MTSPNTANGAHHSMLRRRRRSLKLLAAILATAGLASIVIAATQHHPPKPSKTAQSAPLPANTAPSRNTPTPSHHTSALTSHTPPRPTSLPPIQSGLALNTSAPTHLSIPAIGVSTSIMNLGLNPDGTVQTPPLTRDSIAGWYELSATPGTTGASVILGHIDSAAYGAGVFYRLGALNPGDQIQVQRQDGTTAIFRVDRVTEIPKTQFPTSLVYGPTNYAALRLVTCGGSFDTATGNYLDNIIAFASLISTTH